MKHTEQLFDHVISKLDKEEIHSASGIFNNSVFKKVINEIIEVKSKSIVEDISTQEELNLARFTLEGNREILEVFKRLDASIDKVIKEEFDKNAIIDN
jgi:hypothetical protein